MTDHHQKHTDEEPLVSEVLTVEYLREYSRAQIELLSKNVFKTLQTTKTESLIVYLITISLDPIKRAYLGHPTNADELIKKIWPSEYTLFKTYLEKDKLSINQLSAGSEPFSALHI